MIVSRGDTNRVRKELRLNNNKQVKTYGFHGLHGYMTNFG